MSEPEQDWVGRAIPPAPHWKLFPGTSVKDFPDSGLVDSKLLRELSLRSLFSKRANFGNLLFAQFGAGATSGVHRIGNWLKMVGVDARGVAAQMVKNKTVGNFAPHLLIYIPMSGKPFPRQVKTSVPQLVSKSLPLPTACHFIDHVLWEGAPMNVTIHKTIRTSSDHSMLVPCLGGNLRWLPATALAQPRWIRALVARRNGSPEFGVARRTTLGNDVARSATFDTLGTLHADLLHRSGWAAPRVLTAPLGIFMPPPILAPEYGNVG